MRLFFGWILDCCLELLSRSYSKTMNNGNSFLLIWPSVDPYLKCLYRSSCNSAF